MGIRANITLTDAAVAPVNRVYYPTTSKDNVFFWVDRTQAISAGQNKLSLSQRAATKNAPAYKMDWKLVCPILAEQASGGTTTGYTADPKVSYENLGAISIVVHERSTSQERIDLLAQLRDLIDESIITEQVQNLNLIW